MSTPPLTGLVDLVAEHLFNGLILSSGIFVGTVVLLPLIFRSHSWSAATRHRVWLLTFVCLASTPLLVYWLDWRTETLNAHCWHPALAAKVNSCTNG